jgi:hypothetical protein
MYPERVLHVVSGNRRPGTCKYCGKAIEWATTPKGKFLPLKAHAFVMRTEMNPDTHVRFDVLTADAVHMASCPSQPPRSPRSRAGGRR